MRINPDVKEYKPSETQIAIAFVDYIANVHPNLLPDLIKIDNENKCSWAEGKQKKRMGKRKGASDYLFMRPQVIKKQLKHCISNVVIHSGLWLELKSARGKESPEQKAFGLRAMSNGYAYRVARSVDEAIEAFEEYVHQSSY